MVGAGPFVMDQALWSESQAGAPFAKFKFGMTATPVYLHERLLGRLQLRIGCNVALSIRPSVARSSLSVVVRPSVHRRLSVVCVLAGSPIPFLEALLFTIYHIPSLACRFLVRAARSR